MNEAWADAFEAYSKLTEIYDGYDIDDESKLGKALQAARDLAEELHQICFGRAIYE